MGFYIITPEIITKYPKIMRMTLLPGAVSFSEGLNTPGVTPGVNIRGVSPPWWDLKKHIF